MASNDRPSTSPPSEPPIIPTASESRSRRRGDWPKSLYLFYNHFSPSLWNDSLYKLDLPNPNFNSEPEPEPEVEPISLSPTLVFPAEGRFARGMYCARLGSKVYFLGGQFISKDATLDEIFPRDVYVMDLAAPPSNTIPIKLESQLNAGKPNPLVFVADNKIFVLGGRDDVTVQLDRMPNVDFVEYFHMLKFMKDKQFECYDPFTREWQVLESPPAVKYGASWEGYALLESHNLVLVFGCYENENQRISLVYDLCDGKWAPASERVSLCLRGGYFAAAAAADWSGGYALYGVDSRGMPIKSQCQVTKEEYDLDDNSDLSDNNDETIVEIVNYCRNGSVFDKGLVFRNPYVESIMQVHPLGDGYFCHVVAGAPPLASGPSKYGYLPLEKCIRAVKVVVFKEIDDQQDQHCHNAIEATSTESNSSSFKVKILYSKRFVMKTPTYCMGDLVTAFVVSRDEQRRMIKKMKRNMKRNKSGEEVVAEE